MHLLLASSDVLPVGWKSLPRSLLNQRSGTVYELR
ncbi:hypothetical protein H4W33_005126 [Kibdelosporangium phytohabitans]|nr:hypothetical protein [Kibdelosporangium phytohabitans]